MKAFFLVSLFFFLSQQDPPEAYPGQSQHREPPKGWYCSPEAKIESHQCHCKRMSYRDDDTPTKEKDPMCEEAKVIEDHECKVFCHAQHCLCPVVCEAHPVSVPLAR